MFYGAHRKHLLGLSTSTLTPVRHGAAEYVPEDEALDRLPAGVRE